MVMHYGNLPRVLTLDFMLVVKVSRLRQFHPNHSYSIYPTFIDFAAFGSDEFIFLCYRYGYATDSR